MLFTEMSSVLMYTQVWVTAVSGHNLRTQLELILHKWPLNNDQLATTLGSNGHIVSKSWLIQM